MSPCSITTSNAMPTLISCERGQFTIGITVSHFQANYGLSALFVSAQKQI